MAGEVPRLNEFLDAVCQYMGSWHSYANIMHNFSLDKVCSEPYASFKKLLKLFYRALDPMHRGWFHTFFSQGNLEKGVIDLLFKAHCFTLKTKSKSAFIAILYLCSFAYSLLHYCERNGMNGMLNQMRTFLTDVFTTIEPRFSSEGGWTGLGNFCFSENLPTILRFISNCYCEKAVFSTFVCMVPGVRNIGLHGRETLDLFLSTVHIFENSVRVAFEREINVNLNYKQEIDYAFLMLRSDLQKGPFETYLSQDRSKLAADPTSPLSRI